MVTQKSILVNGLEMWGDEPNRINRDRLAPLIAFYAMMLDDKLCHKLMK